MARPVRRHPAPAATLVAALLAAPGTFACGEDASPPPVAARPPSETAALEALSGPYAVRGVTVQALSGRQREITGTLHLAVTGGRYRVEFELETTAPDFAEPVPVDVRGTGTGFVVGEVFTGTTEEWMTLHPTGGLADVPLTGVELPDRAGRKLVSSSRASFDENGVFQIVMENYPGPGDDYEPSMTVLEGRRVGGAQRD